MNADEPPVGTDSTMETQVVLKSIPGGQSRAKDNKTSEKEIKAYAKSDREKAYYMMVQRYKRPLFYHAQYMLRNEEEAMDVTQETFLKAYEEERIFNEDFYIQAWLFRVTTNLCHNILRSSKRKQKAMDTILKEEEPKTSGTDVLISNAEDKEKILFALDKLPKKDKTILLLRYYNNLSYKEISAAMKCKLGTVMSRLGRARMRLSRSVHNEM